MGIRLQNMHKRRLTFQNSDCKYFDNLSTFMQGEREIWVRHEFAYHWELSQAACSRPQCPTLAEVAVSHRCYCAITGAAGQACFPFLISPVWTCGAESVWGSVALVEGGEAGRGYGGAGGVRHGVPRGGHGEQRGARHWTVLHTWRGSRDQVQNIIIR